MAIATITRSTTTVNDGFGAYNNTVTGILVEHAATGTHGVVTATTVNALTLTAAATGFTIAGGTSSKTLTLDANLTASYLADITSAEADQIEAIGTTTISAAQWGYVGASTTHPLGADGTAGRIPRGIYLKIDNGTTGVSLKCSTGSRWNGDIIAVTDDIAKDATTGNFSLSADGKTLTVEASGLTGNCVYALGFLYDNHSGTDYKMFVYTSGNDIVVQALHITTGAAQDITTPVDTGYMAVMIFYITTA